LHSVTVTPQPKWGAYEVGYAMGLVFLLAIAALGIVIAIRTSGKSRIPLAKEVAPWQRDRR
jgi:hypothetical protein